MKFGFFAGLALPLLTALSALGSPLTRDNTGNSTCQTVNGAVFVDATCIDPTYSTPVLDGTNDTTIDGVGVHIVSGHWNGTNINFNLYFPSNKKTFQNRFFQFVYPLYDEFAEPDQVGFSLTSGGYVVQVKGTLGFRHEAATAKFSRKVAADYFGLSSKTKIYGYAYGGSGGSYQMSGILESTSGVWQGGVPYIQAIPTSIPFGQQAIGYGTFVLGDKLNVIQDAVRPGGSGDPRPLLSPMEVAVYNEVSKLGIPYRGWQSLNQSYAANFVAGSIPLVKAFDGTYANDFWTVNGYLGTEQSDLGNFFRSKRAVGSLDISNVQYNGSAITSFTTSAFPTNLSNFAADYSIVSSNGTVIGAIQGLLNTNTSTFTAAGTPYTTPLASGSRLRYDNSWYVACNVYSRYQIPRRPDYYPWDQYKSANGSPIYPQRSVDFGSIISSSVTGGVTQTGKILFPAIAVQNMLDVNAFPWDADWYRKQIVRSIGDDSKMYRIYFNDNADHFEVGQFENNNYAPYVLNYYGSLWQALLDVAAWAEKGTKPPKNSQYSFDQFTQPQLPYEAKKRGGIQPVVHLSIKPQKSVTKRVRVGEKVSFCADAEVPTDDGCIVQVAWDYEGNNNFVNGTIGKAKKQVELSGQYASNKPGTYFAAVRVRSSRKCDVNERYVLPPNLDRVRVIVA